MQGRKGKGDKEYRPPKQKPVLSEDEEDDFEDVVADAASTAVSERSILTRIRSFHHTRVQRSVRSSSWMALQPLWLSRRFVPEPDIIFKDNLNH
jgi:hypothetical protein